MSKLLQWAKQLKREVVTLWFCYRHPRTPLIAKLLAVCVVAYAFSPIDLIPDFIPVLGLLDDALLLPLGIWLTLKFIPHAVLAECRGQAVQWMEESHNKPRNWYGAAIVIALWIAAVALCWYWFFA